MWVNEYYPGAGPWGFLDARAYRYYLPAALVVCLKTGEGSGFDCLLTLYSIPKKKQRPSDFSRRQHSLDQWSLLNDRQQRCVYRFLILMKSIELWIERDREDAKNWIGDWTVAIESYWERYAEGV